VDFKFSLVDFDSREPIPGAYLEFRDSAGNFLQRFAMDSGVLEISDTDYPLVLAEGVSVIARAPGHLDAASGIPGLIPDFELSREQKPFPWMLVALGTGLAISTMPARRKQVAGINIKPYLPYVPALVGIGLGGLVVYKVGQKFGIFDDAEDQRRKREAAEREADGQNSMDAICRATPSSRSNADWIAICDKIEAGLDYAGYLQSYADEVVVQLSKAENDCDVQKLIYYFGHRELKSPFLIKGGDYTLSKGVLERLSQDDVDSLNADYRYKGISFRW